MSKGLSQGPYVAARAGVEPLALWTKGVDSTKAPPSPHFFLPPFGCQSFYLCPLFLPISTLHVFHAYISFLSSFHLFHLPSLPPSTPPFPLSVLPFMCQFVHRSHRSSMSPFLPLSLVLCLPVFLQPSIHPAIHLLINSFIHP